MKSERKRAIRSAPAQASHAAPEAGSAPAPEIASKPTGRPVAAPPRARAMLAAADTAVAGELGGTLDELQHDLGAERGAAATASIERRARQSAGAEAIGSLEREARTIAARPAPAPIAAGGAQLRTDPAAAAATRAFGAPAVTLGNQVLFAEGAYRPDTADGQRRIRHELAHVEQHRAGRVPRGVALFDGPDPDRTGDVAPSPPRAPQADDVLPDPVEPFAPMIDTWDPATFWTPPGTSRPEIANRLYGDPNHVGGFDIIGDKHVRMRSFEGVTASDFVTAMRAALDSRLQSNVTALVSRVSERRIDAEDERWMISIMTWWASRSDLTNAAGRGYYDVLLDELDTHRLTEWGLFSDTTRPASDWVEIEVEGQQDVLMLLRARRSSRGGARYVRTGTRVEEYDRVNGQIPTTGLRTLVGAYSYREPAPPAALYSTTFGNGSIYVTQQLVDEPTATRAETALRNSPHRGPRVMIPGGNGHFYGYAVNFPFFNEDYVANQRTLTNYWWHYPGTVFIQGGEYRPDFGAGGTAETSHRAEILTAAIGASGNEAVRGLDFDVLAQATSDQRFSLIERALAGVTVGDASLIARVLYGVPAAEFPAFERRLSTSGMMNRIIGAAWPPGAMAVIGRIFSVRALQTMRVPGENLQALPEVEAGIDSDGYYRYTYPRTAMSASTSVATFGVNDTVRIGNEPTPVGGATGPMQRSTLTLQPGIARVSNAIVEFGRGLARTLVVDNGPAVGPMLPTQLVRVRILGPNSSTRIVTALEAVGLTEMPTHAILSGVLSRHANAGMLLLAGMQLGRAFGPALAEGLAEGGGARVVLGSLGRAAATEAGGAALTNAAIIGGINFVESYRREIAATEAGRTFLELYDITLMLWVARDLGRLVASGLVPRLVGAVDTMRATGAWLRDGLMPLRQELDAIGRAIRRFGSTAEAAEAAVAGGGTAAASTGAATQPGFFSMLRVARGEVAAEALASRTAGTAVDDVSRRVLGRLGGLVERTEATAARLAADTAATTPQAQAARAAATVEAEAAARARLAVAQRANTLRPDAREAYLRAVDAAIAARPNSIGAMADLLTAAAASRQPNVFMAQVQQLLARPLSPEALRTLGAKVLQGPGTLDLAWLNRTSIDNATLEFLARDARTPWDLFRRVAANPADAGPMIQFRIRARGIGAEMAAESEATRLGTDVRRQVPMGTSEIDYAMSVGGRTRGFEVKGWTVETWTEALDAAVKRLNHRALTTAEAEAVAKIDHMLGQLRDIRSATGAGPFLGVTDALPANVRSQLQRVLQRSGIPDATLVTLSEGTIKSNAAVSVGQSLGIPRP